MSTIGLSAPAAFVLRSLYEHPDKRLPDAILEEAAAGRPDATASLDLQAVQDGLAELQSRGLAEEQPDGGWRLTEAVP